MCVCMLTEKKKLAPTPLYPDKRLAPIHNLLCDAHVYPPPSVYLLLGSSSDPVRVVVPLVRPVLFRSARGLVFAAFCLVRGAD